MSLISAIESRYGLRILNWKRVKDVYCVETSDHVALCLKPYSFSAEEVQFIGEIQQQITARGFADVPQTLVTRDDSLYIQHGDQYFMLTNWVRGRAPTFGHAKQLYKSVRTLANLHQHAQHLTLSFIPAGRHRVWTLKERFSHAGGAVQKFNNRGKYRTILELCEAAIEQLESKQVRDALRMEADAGAVCHGDFNYPNLVVDENGNYQVIDFDNTSHHVRMEDLAHIIHRNRPWNLDGALKLMAVYDSVRPLSREDISLLVALLHEPYPLVRAVRQKRSTRFVDVLVPNRTALINYAKGLCRLL